jgi:hypothetical protein
VVIEHGVHERSPDLRVVVAVAGLARGGGAVAFTLDAPDEAPATTVGDVAQLLHIHVEQVPGGRVFVAADRLAGDPVEVGEAVDPTPAST